MSKALSRMSTEADGDQQRVQRPYGRARHTAVSAEPKAVAKQRVQRPCGRARHSAVWVEPKAEADGDQQIVKRPYGTEQIPPPHSSAK